MAPFKGFHFFPAGKQLKLSCPLESHCLTQTWVLWKSRRQRRLSLPCHTSCEHNKFIGLRRGDKRNRVKGVYSYLSATNCTKERSGEERKIRERRHGQGRAGQDGWEMHFLSLCPHGAEQRPGMHEHERARIAGKAPLAMRKSHLRSHLGPWKWNEFCWSGGRKRRWECTASAASPWLCMEAVGARVFRYFWNRMLTQKSICPFSA